MQILVIIYSIMYENGRVCMKNDAYSVSSVFDFDFIVVLYRIF